MAWRPVASATGYRLYVKHGTGSFALAAEKTSLSPGSDGSLRATLQGLSLSGTTRFAIAAFNSGGESGRSNEVALDYATVARVVDSDGDGLTDAEEDKDLDGVVDANETDPKLRDTDADGLSDFDERFVYRTNPLVADTDGDGSWDGTEVLAGTGPLDASKAPNVWVVAAPDANALSGSMTTSSTYTRGQDDDPLADSLSETLVFPQSGENAFNAESDDFVRYVVNLPMAGRWYLWARMYYPGLPGSNDANSFFTGVDGSALAKLGNNVDYFRRWHWDGDGEAMQGPPVPLPLGQLSAGKHTLTIEKREVLPIPPRVDMLVLTPDANFVPSDALALAGLSAAKSPNAPPTTTTTTTLPPTACSSNADCNDGNACNGVERCTVGVGCTAGAAPQCNDGNACNGVETCDPSAGCRAGTAPTCDDGNVCNGVETCDPSSGCRSGAPLACDDGKFCNGVESCDAKLGCRPGRLVQCGVLSSLCQRAACSETARGCVLTAAADGTACSDGATCSGPDYCRGGVCVGVDLCPSGQTCDTIAGVCAYTDDKDNDGMFDPEDYCPGDARNRCFGHAAVDRRTNLPIRINAGNSRASCSGKRTDCNGDVWQEDFGYRKRLGSTSCTLLEGCNIADVPILFGCNDLRTQDVFRCDHASRKGKRKLEYHFDVAPGVYLVNLYFAETHVQVPEPGMRVFDITVGDTVVYPNFDQLAAAGGPGLAVIRSAFAEVTDERGLDIVLTPRIGSVAIKAIEVLTVQ